MASQQEHQARLEVETLEDRLAPARHITLDSMGDVFIAGTPRSDKVVVSSAPGGRVKVTLSGGARQVAWFARAQVQEIVFEGNGGHDRFINRIPCPVPGLTPALQSRDALPPVDGSGALTADEFLLYQWTNMDREMSGQAALFVNPLLQSVAQAHADDMASQDRFGDTDTDGHILNGHDLVYRVGAVGYAWSTLGENVAYNLGFADPAAAFMEQWWNSPPHRANILNPAFTETGLGVARGASGRTYAVQVFARPASPSRVSLLFILAWR